MLTPNRLRYHYQLILRQDLLQKCSHSSIMSIPKLVKITICARVPYESVQKKQLTLEILSGQKAIFFQSSTGNSAHFTKATRAIAGSGSKLRFYKGMKEPDYFVQTCLRGPVLFQFLEKLTTIWFFEEIQAQIKGNTIELIAPYKILRMFPEIQHNFGQLSIQNLQIILHTSSQSEKQTELICSCLLGAYRK